jgi:hypothetical protein
MNKKLFVGAAALATVTVAGVVYYRWVKTRDAFQEDDTEERQEMDDQRREVIDRILEKNEHLAEDVWNRP